MSLLHLRCFIQEFGTFPPPFGPLRGNTKPWRGATTHPCSAFGTRGLGSLNRWVLVLLQGVIPRSGIWAEGLVFQAYTRGLRPQILLRGMTRDGVCAQEFGTFPPPFGPLRGNTKPWRGATTHPCSAFGTRGLGSLNRRVLVLLQGVIPRSGIWGLRP
jgi:hypothetical protein